MTAHDTVTIIVALVLAIALLPLWMKLAKFWLDSLRDAFNDWGS